MAITVLEVHCGGEADCMDYTMLGHQRLVCKIPLHSFTLRSFSEPLKSGSRISNGSIGEL
jgi:hypothetical protein